MVVKMRSFGLLSLFILSFIGSAQEIELATAQPLPVNPYVSVYEASSSWSVDQVYNGILENELKRMDSKTNLGMVDTSSYWLYFTISNQTETENKYLELQNPQMDLIRLHKVGEDGAFSLIHEMGDQFIYSKRPVDSRYFVMPIAIEKGEKSTFLMKVQKFKSAVSFPLVIYDASIYAKKSAREQIFLGLYFGILFLLALMSAIIGLIAQKRLFLVYGLYVAAFGLWFFSREGFTYKFITSNYPILNTHFYPFCTSLTVLFLILYLQHFFKTKTLMPRFHKLMLFFAWFLTVGFGVWLIFPEEFLDFAPKLFAIRYLILFCTIVFAYTSSIKSLRSEPLRAKLFLLGYSVFFLGVLIEIADEYGLLDVHSFIIPPIMIGYLVEVFALTIAMSLIILETFKHREELLISNQELVSSVSELESQITEDQASYLTLKSKAVLDPQKIRYIQSDDHYLEFYLVDRDNPEVDRNKLSEIKKVLPSQFAQVHRSIIVNLSHVKSVFSDKIQMRGGEELRLSRTYKKDLEDRLI